jgi:hypothetical protein
MTDKKQSAVARRLADTKVAPLYQAQETQLEELKTQVNKHESTLISLNSYSVALDQSISKDKDNITDLITRTDKLEIYTTLEQGTLAGRWSSSGTGYQQPVSIGYGLKLSNGGVLSAATSQVADATLSITAGNGLLGGGDLTQNRTISVNFAANGEVSSSKAVRADDSRLTGSTTSTGLFDIDGGDSGAYTGNPILDGGGA